MRAHPGAQSGQNVAHEGIAVLRQPVMHPFPVPPRIHQTGTPQESEVPRNLWLIEAQSVVQIADTDLAGREKIQQAQSRRIRQGLKELRRLSWLLFLQEGIHICENAYVSNVIPSGAKAESRNPVE